MRSTPAGFELRPAPVSLLLSLLLLPLFSVPAFAQVGHRQSVQSGRPIAHPRSPGSSPLLKRSGQSRAADSFHIETRTVITDDGWELALKHIYSDVRTYHTPLLMFHGLCSNHATWDLNDKTSLARYLAGHGFDTWLLDWRGAGDSERPPRGQPLDWDFSVDDLIHRDAPAAIQGVLDATGESQVYLIGHSMGGLVIYGVMTTEPIASKVAGIVSFAGAGLVGMDGDGDEPPSQVIMSLAGTLSPLLIDDLILPTQDMAYAMANIPGWSWVLEAFSRWAGIWIWNPRNVNVPLINNMLNDAVGDTSFNIVQQFGEFAHHFNVLDFAGALGHARPSSFYEANGRLSYVDLYPTIEAPALLLAGGWDRLVSKENVKLIYDALSSQDKTYLELSRSNGFSFDYGHVDMVMGVAAPLEVFPAVDEWLEARAE